MPMSQFAAYQLGTWLPWWIKRYVGCNKRAYLAPLYHFDESEMVMGGAKGQGARVHVDDIEKH